MEAFTKFITDILNPINSVVWGPIMLVLLLGTGLFLTFALRFITILRIPLGFKMLWTKRKGDSGAEGELSPFNALMTALSATVGTGNIVGVAGALYAGGPGALFWMWCTALVGMATKFSEVLLAMRYRETTPEGNVVGGPMYYIKNGLGPKWAWMGTAFAIFGAIAGFGIGNLTQTNSISDAIQDTFKVDTWITAVVLTILVGSVLLGGVKRIGAVAGKVVPFMAVFYVFTALIVIILKIDQIPHIFTMIIEQAFTPSAAFGATIWIVISKGVARGVFSNEAGLGSAPIAHATATTKEPMTQALIGMLGTFIDTIIICTMTGFGILASGLLANGPGAVEGAPLTIAAFNTVLDPILPAAFAGAGGYAVTISLALFAFTTILGWCVYGERCVVYLFGDKGLMPFRLLFTLVVPLGALAEIKVVWVLAEIFNALMAIPNLIALLLLSPVILTLVKEYKEREAAKALK